MILGHYHDKTKQCLLHFSIALIKEKWIILAIMFLVAQTVKNLPAMQQTWVWSLGWEDPLEEGMAVDCSVLAWRIPMDRGAWWAAVQGVAKSWIQLSD